MKYVGQNRLFLQFECKWVNLGRKIRKSGVSEKKKEENGRTYYVYEISTEMGLMINIYDKEVIELELIEGLRYNRKCTEEDIKEIMIHAVSLTFYGDKAVNLGVSLGYIHPEAIKELKGVKIAMFIRI